MVLSMSGKTKALIIFAVTAKLICVFVLTYAKSRFSHDAAQISLVLMSGNAKFLNSIVNSFIYR